MSDAGAAVVETHISVVVFVGDRAYKLKKPVRFSFLDLRDREARADLCRREVELNRRLSPDVYLGVADVVGPDGSVCDHLVVMRRMRADRCLSTLVERDDPVVAGALDELAALLSRFHREAGRSSVIDLAGGRDCLEEEWRANAGEMRAFDGSVFPAGLVDRTLERALTYLGGREPLLAARRAAGHICDGHGDLMADDIYVLPDGPRVLDCIEFDDRLRHGDVAADVAFLAMDLERLGRPDLAARFIKAYEAASGTPIPPSLLDLSIAYRAQVRAKVTALRADQLQAAGEDPGPAVALARRFLELCDRHVRAAGVHLVVVGGLPGTGKSTVARALAGRFGWRVLRSDVVRKQLAGLPETEPAAAGFHEGLYDPGSTDDTYRAMLAQASALLAQGETVVLDASFTAERFRHEARRIAAAASAGLVELRCTLDPSEATRRMTARRARGGDAWDADAAVAARLAAEADPWPEATELATAGPPDTVAERAAGIVAQACELDLPESAAMEPAALRETGPS